MVLKRITFLISSMKCVHFDLKDFTCDKSLLQAKLEEELSIEQWLNNIKCAQLQILLLLNNGNINSYSEYICTISKTSANIENLQKWTILHHNKAIVTTLYHIKKWK